MIYPIIAYGDTILTKTAEPIDKDFPNLKELVADMFATMYKAEGVGLAAPQIGKSIRIFIIDSTQFDEEKTGEKGLKRVFINAEKVEETGEVWSYEEGCLSIPKITENVKRPDTLKLRYLDENFEVHEEVFKGITARVIQHEYDHIEGILFVDHLKPLRKRLIKSKLGKITKGNIKVKYRMKFPNPSRR